MPSKHIKKEFSSDEYSLQNFIDVILNVDEYKNFIPHCTKSKILEKQENALIAEIEISFSIFKVSYISKIDFNIEANKASIEVREHGKHTFKNLLNIWNLKLENEKIIIDFFVDFEMKKMILNTAVSASLAFISEMILNSFLKRIKQVKKHH
jgi:coenzyme Q-binding protein COQ10